MSGRSWYRRACDACREGMIDEAIHTLIKDSTETGVDYMQNADLRRAVERHPVIGARKLEELGFPQPIVEAIRHHHEWYNGAGYPDGLKGEKIPAAARILAIADAYDAITSQRAYRPARSREEAIGIVGDAAGTQFDPKHVGAFVEMMRGEP